MELITNNIYGRCQPYQPCRIFDENAKTVDFKKVVTYKIFNMKTEFLKNCKSVTGTVGRTACKERNYSRSLLSTGTKCKTIKNYNYGKD